MGLLCALIISRPTWAVQASGQVDERQTARRGIITAWYAGWEIMRTILNLSNELAPKVRQLARQRRKALGAIVSRLTLRVLERMGGPEVRNGVPFFAAHPGAAEDGVLPDLELVNRLRDQDP